MTIDTNPLGPSEDELLAEIDRRRAELEAAAKVDRLRSEIETHMTIDDGSLGTLADALAPLVEHLKEQKAEIDRLRALVAEANNTLTNWQEAWEAEGLDGSASDLPARIDAALDGGAPCATCDGTHRDVLLAALGGIEHEDVAGLVEVGVVEAGDRTRPIESIWRWDSPRSVWVFGEDA